MNNNQNPTSDRIATIGGKQKFFDFRDGLVPAYQKDYAMLHGGGGSKFAPSSVIRLTITDYSKGTGQASTTVQANVMPSLIEILRDKAAANMGTTYVPVNEGAWGLIFKSIRSISRISARVRAMNNCLGTLLNGLIEAARAAVKGQPTKDIWTAAGVSMSNSLTAIKEGENKDGQQDNPAFIALPFVYDYHYEQTRVNTHKRSQTNPNLVSVSVLKIIRSGYRQNGEMAKLPWSITISNFYAAERKYPNGTSSYDPNTVDFNSKREAFFTLSDDDMYRAASRVCHYVQVFEMAVCLPIVRDGRKAMEQERMAGRNQPAPSYGQQQPQPPRQSYAPAGTSQPPTQQPRQPQPQRQSYAPAGASQPPTQPPQPQQPRQQQPPRQRWGNNRGQSPYQNSQGAPVYQNSASGWR